MSLLVGTKRIVLSTPYPHETETSKKIKAFKSNAQAQLVKAQAKVPRKRKKRDEKEDPTYTPGMQLTVSTIVQRSCYLQGRIA